MLVFIRIQGIFSFFVMDSMLGELTNHSATFLICNYNRICQRITINNYSALVFHIMLSHERGTASK